MAPLKGKNRLHITQITHIPVFPIGLRPLASACTENWGDKRHSTTSLHIYTGVGVASRLSSANGVAAAGRRRFGLFGREVL